jgi:hypothetical protein
MYRCSCLHVSDCLKQQNLLLALGKDDPSEDRKTCLYEQKRAESPDLIPALLLRPVSLHSLARPLFLTSSRWSRRSLATVGWDGSHRPIACVAQAMEDD